MSDRKRIASAALFVILIACTIGIVGYVMSNGSTPVGPPTVVPVQQPTATPNVISPSINRISSNRWGVPGWTFNTVTNTPALTNDVMYLVPIRVQYAQEWDAIAVGVNTAGANGILRVCTYGIESVPYDQNGLSPGTLAFDFGTASATTTGTKTILGTFSPDTLSSGFYFMAVIVRADTGLVMRSVNPFDAIQSPISAISTGAGGGVRFFALETDPDTDFIDVGCPVDGTGLVTAITGNASYPIVWIRQNG